MVTDAQAPRPLILSQHAEKVIAERQIALAWIARTLDYPERIEADRVDSTLLHALARIPERDGRVLRVVYNHTVTPWRIVTVYFDRTQRRKR